MRVQREGHFGLRRVIQSVALPPLELVIAPYSRRSQRNQSPPVMGTGEFRRAVAVTAVIKRDGGYRHAAGRIYRRDRQSAGRHNVRGVRIAAVFNLRTVRVPVAVGVRIERIGAGVRLVHVHSRVSLHTVEQPVVVRIGIVRIGTGIRLVNVHSRVRFNPIRQPVTVRVDVLVSADIVLFSRAFRAQTRCIKRSELALEICGRRDARVVLNRHLKLIIAPCRDRAPGRPTPDLDIVGTRRQKSVLEVRVIAMRAATLAYR